MRTKYSCDVCVSKEGKLCQCDIRTSCCDDASSLDKREQVYATLPLPEEIVKYEQGEAQI